MNIMIVLWLHFTYDAGHFLFLNGTLTEFRYESISGLGHSFSNAVRVLGWEGGVTRPRGGHTRPRVAPSCN